MLRDWLEKLIVTGMTEGCRQRGRPSTRYTADIKTITGMTLGFKKLVNAPRIRIYGGYNIFQIVGAQLQKDCWLNIELRIFEISYLQNGLIVSITTRRIKLFKYFHYAS